MEVMTRSMDRLERSMSADLILESKHKIFLSHSGVQKEFVHHLCKALEERHQYPFFDKRPSSLPKGEKYPYLILEAAKQCQMAVVVVSEDYFMSKWPMIELHAFVQAQRLKSNTKLKILPLFYGLSVREFHDETRQMRWFNQWETWAKDDAQGRIKVNEWKVALDTLVLFTGISYNRELQEIVTYENEIVSHICYSISADIKWNDSHVQGKSNICKVIIEKIQESEPSKKYEVNVVGIYGVGGIGKTTICKTLCNEFSNDYEGKTCHIEFGSKNLDLIDLLRKVLMDLTSTRSEVLQKLNGGECKDILYKILVNQRTFLALDNVWDDHQSIKQAKMFLKARFHERSLVIVTARFQSTIELLGIKEDVCLEMSELRQADATNLFLYHAAGPRKQFERKEDKRDILECIQSCYYKKGDKGGYHYHPLALEALGIQLGCLGEKPSDWVRNLWRIKNFSYLEGENPVFAILRSSFDLLPPTQQNLFMDVVIYRPTWSVDSNGGGIDLMEWLCLVYKPADELEIKSQLDCLKGKGLLQDVDLASGRISMHDLYREFVELEVEGKLDASTDLEKRRWVNVKNGDLSELESTPGGGCWPKLVRVGIQQLSRGGHDPPPRNQIENLEGIEWQYCSNVVVLKLHGLRWVRGTLNLERLKCLRSLQLQDIVALDRLEGLEGLKNLTFFRWCYFDFSLLQYTDVDTHIVGQFPASLKVLQIEVGVMLGPDVLARCNNLCMLVLKGIQVGNLDLSRCSSLQTVTLTRVRYLQILSGLTAGWASRLQSLQVWWCQDLVEIPGLGHLIGLERLVLVDCPIKELPELQKLTKLRVLNLWNQKISEPKVRLGDGSGVCIPRQRLRELCYRRAGESTPESTRAPDLNGFEQLEVLDLSNNEEWTYVEGLAKLPALRRLNLSCCRITWGLPDLSDSTNLVELNLRGCEMKLHEYDIGMLSRLPRLQPVLVGQLDYSVRLHFGRRKMLKYLSHFNAPKSWLAWKEHEWEEFDLAIPPIRIGRSGIRGSDPVGNITEPLLNMITAPSKISLEFSLRINHRFPPLE